MRRTRSWGGELCRRWPRSGIESPPHSWVGVALMLWLRPAVTYADNRNHLGVDKEKVDRAHSGMIAALHSKGLDTHDLVESTTLSESLGVRVDGLLGTVQVSAARDHRLDQALLACSSRPALSGEELQVVVGHMTMRALLNRGLLSILRHIYVFIQEN